ncbi:sulfatase [bacterium]|nr:sulfatase [bacterium]
MSKSRYNLVHIFADEMREMAMSCSGNPDVCTPNMDRLAAQGARFTRMFTPDPVCSPARASLMTGLLPYRTGVIRNGIRLAEQVPCIAELTAAEGYVTAHIGKWHLDGTGGREDGYDLVPALRHRGFAYWAGYEHGHRYWNARYFTEKDEEVKLPEGVYAPDAMTDLAIEFLRKHAQNPFHLDLSWGPPHFPLDQAKPEDRARFNKASITLRPNVPEKFADEAREDYANYYAMVENLDWNLRRILDALDELHLAGNTIVIFTSDHGDMLLSHGQHFKRRPTEESIRVPFLIRCPDLIPAGQVIDTLACLTDVVPTCLELMGIELPKTDGLSHVPELTKRGEPVKRDSIYLSCMWLGCRDYDLGLHAKRAWRGIRTEHYMGCYLKESDRTMRSVELYDLNADPYEMNNLAVAEEFDDMQADLARQLNEWIQNTNDTLFSGLMLTM